MQITDILVIELTRNLYHQFREELIKTVQLNINTHVYRLKSHMFFLNENPTT